MESITRPSTSSSLTSSHKPSNIAAAVVAADPTAGPQLKPAAEPDKIIFTSPPLDSEDFRASDLAFTAPRVPSSAATAVVAVPPEDPTGNGLEQHQRHRHHLRDDDDDQTDSGSAPPGFRLRPRGHSAPMIISRVTEMTTASIPERSLTLVYAQIPVKTFQTAANAVVSGPMPEKGHEGHHHHHHEERPFTFANALPLKVRNIRRPKPRKHKRPPSFFQSPKQPRFLDAGNTLGPSDIDTSESNSNHVVYSHHGGGGDHGEHGHHDGDHNHLDNAHHHGRHTAISKRIDGQ